MRFPDVCGNQHGRVRLELVGVGAELLGYEVDVVRLTGQPQPAFLVGVMGLSEFFHCGGRVAHGIQADGEELNLVAHVTREHVADHRQVTRHQRARALAVGEDKADDDNVVLEHVIVKPRRCPFWSISSTFVK